MTHFTPTTEQVRDAYVRAMRNAFIASAGEHREEFDRWLEVLLDPLEKIRLEYAHYLDGGDMHELARAIGQVLGTDDDILPESERIVVGRPGEDNK